MRLNAEGLKPAEINKRAVSEPEPFKVTRQQVDYYRDKCEVDIKQLQAQAKFKALNTGLALKDERVQVLRDLAEPLIVELKGGKVWVPGKYGNVFNKAEFDTLRGLLDDIAKELGDRSTKAELGTDDGEFEFRIHFVGEK
jgi:hypothetical protein